MFLIEIRGNSFIKFNKYYSNFCNYLCLVMKKIVVLLLLLVYGSATMGTTVHIHYCMNKMAGWSLIDSNDHQCHTCGMEKKGGCCKDSKTQIKLASDQQKAEISGAATFNSSQFCLLPIVSEYLLVPIAETNVGYLYHVSPPLLLKSVSPEFLCVYRI